MFFIRLSLHGHNDENRKLHCYYLILDVVYMLRVYEDDYEVRKRGNWFETRAFSKPTTTFNW